MKYKGKYSLKENLLHGRGMNVLKESILLEYSVPRPGVSPSDICEPVKGTQYTGQDFLNLKTPADVDALVKGGSNHVGWITQKKAAKRFLAAGAQIAWIGSGAQNEDLVVVVGGTQYSVEVGRPTKVTQLGNMAGDAVNRSDSTSQKVIDKQEKVGQSITRGNNPRHPEEYDEAETLANVGAGEISLGQMGSYWRADGVDMLLMIEESDKSDSPDDNPSFKICACSEEGLVAGDALFGGIASMADILNQAYAGELGKGKTSGFSNRAGGSASADGSTHRGGFGAFPKLLKAGMTSI